MGVSRGQRGRTMVTSREFKTKLPTPIFVIDKLIDSFK